MVRSLSRISLALAVGVSLTASAFGQDANPQGQPDAAPAQRAAQGLKPGSSHGVKPVVIDRSVIYKPTIVDPYDRKNFYGFNHAASVTRLSDGRLLAAWFSGPFEGSVDQVIYGCTSGDGGKTWSEGVVLNDQKWRSDFDPAFIADGDRTWMFYSVGRWNRYPFIRPAGGQGARGGEAQEVGIDSFKTFVRYTDDAGKTWSDEQRIGDYTGWGPRSNGIKLSTGELILPTHQYQKHLHGVVKSSDGGKTWRKIEAPPQEEKIGAAEPSVAECLSGKLLMVLRSKDGWLWTTSSTDKGETWSPVTKTDLVAAASSHSLIRLKDGRLLLTHNPSKPPLRTPLTMRVSTDEGQSWHEPTEIASIEPPKPGDEVWTRQVSYPSAIELPDGTVIAVWGEISISNSEQSGIIHCARVRFE